MPTWTEAGTVPGFNRPTISPAGGLALQQVHWATTRSRHFERDSRCSLLDHRYPVRRAGRRRQQAPLQIAHAVQGSRARGARPCCGRGRTIRHSTSMVATGSTRSARASDYPYWVGRPIELPKSRPLAFEGGPDVVTGSQAGWPLNQVVKCLVYYHPDDPAEALLRTTGSGSFCRLFDACRETRRELLVEVIAPARNSASERTHIGIARAVEQALRDRRVSRTGGSSNRLATAPRGAISEAVILRGTSPHCHGVVQPAAFRHPSPISLHHSRPPPPWGSSRGSHDRPGPFSTTRRAKA